MSFPSRDDQLNEAENPDIVSKRFVNLTVDWSNPAASLPEVATAGLVSFSPRQRTLTAPSLVSGVTWQVAWFLEEVSVSEVGNFRILDSEGDELAYLSLSVEPGTVYPYDGVHVTVTLDEELHEVPPVVRLEYPCQRHLEGTVLAGDRQSLNLPGDLVTVYAADAPAGTESVPTVYEVKVRGLNNR